MENNSLETNNNIIIYTTDDGQVKIKIDVRLENELNENSVVKENLSTF